MGCGASAVPASPAPRPPASLPVHTGVGGHPYPVAPTRAVPAPQAEGSHRAGWMVGAGVARGAGPGDRKLSSPEQTAPGRTGHDTPGQQRLRPGAPTPVARKAGGQGRLPGPGARIESRASSDGGSFNGIAAYGPGTWGPSALLQRDQSQSDKETGKTQTRTRSTRLHVRHTDTHSGDTTRETSPSLPRPESFS